MISLHSKTFARSKCACSIKPFPYPTGSSPVWLYLFSWCFLSLFALYAQEQPDTTSPNIHITGEVVITGSRIATDTRHLPMSISIIPSTQIEKSQQPSLLPLLTEQVPGFFATSRGLMGYGVATGAAGGMTVRGIGGSPTTGLLVLIDGHPQYMGLMGHPLSDAYQSMMAEQVEVLRGAASVLYGSNAMGGVVNIVTKKMHEDGSTTGIKIGGGSYNTITTEVNNQFKNEDLSGIITASYNRTDGHRQDIGFEQYGGYAKVGYDLSPTWNIFGDVNLTHFNASNPGTISAPILDNDSRVTRGVASLALENDYDKTAGCLKLFYNWGQHRINNGYAADAQPLAYRFHSDDIMLGVSAYQSATLFVNNQLTVGADYIHYGGKAYNHFLTDGHDVQLVNETESEAAAYIDCRQTLTEYLIVNVAVRAHKTLSVPHENPHQARSIEWIPQAGISAELPFNVNLKLMASKGFRNPTIRELYMFDIANPELTPERLWSYELSLMRQTLNGRLGYGLNLFYINGDNMIQTQNVNGRPQNVNVGKVQNWGIETNVTYYINSTWNIVANYSWLNMKYPVIAAPEHKFYVNANFAKSDFKLGTSLQYVAGLRTAVTPVVTKESFVLLNFKGSYQLTKLFELYVRGENLLAQDYSINYGYPMPGAIVFGGFNLIF